MWSLNKVMISKLRNVKNLIWNILTQLVNMYYKALPFRNGINAKDQRCKKIIVSFTSYPRRFGAIPLTLKSILYQSCKPDKIICYLVKDECNEKLPSSLLELQRYGLDIVYVDENLKPHNKYFYSMQGYPNDIIITIDDDVLYPRNLIKRLYKSYGKYPNCISAARVHRMKIISGKLCEYNEWDYQYSHDYKPSHWLFATGVGGVLFPPNILPDLTFDSTYIKELCLDADDIWLKFMELINNIKVVYVPKANRVIWCNGKFSLNGLFLLNVKGNQNDKYIESVSKFLNISIGKILDDTE